MRIGILLHLKIVAVALEFTRLGTAQATVLVPSVLQVLLVVMEVHQLALLASTPSLEQALVLNVLLVSTLQQLEQQHKVSVTLAKKVITHLKEQALVRSVLLELISPIKLEELKRVHAKIGAIVAWVLVRL